MHLSLLIPVYYDFSITLKSICEVNIIYKILCQKNIKQYRATEEKYKIVIEHMCVIFFATKRENLLLRLSKPFYYTKLDTFFKHHSFNERIEVICLLHITFAALQIL